MGSSFPFSSIFLGAAGHLLKFALSRSINLVLLDRIHQPPMLTMYPLVQAGSPNTALTNRHTVNISGINDQHDPKALRLLCPRPPHQAMVGNRQLAGGSEIGEDDGDDDDEFRTLAGVGVWGEYLWICCLCCDVRCQKDTDSSSLKSLATII